MSGEGGARGRAGSETMGSATSRPGQGEEGLTREALLAALAETRAEQAATADILATISRGKVDLETILVRLIRAAIDLCGGARGVIWLEQGGQLVLGAHAGYPPEWVTHALANPITPGPDSDTVSGRVAASGEVYNVGDLPADPRFSAYSAHKVGDYRGCLAAPLISDGVVAGVIVTTRPEPGLFTERQVDLIHRFSNQAAIAVQNARLFNETQEALEHQSATAEVLQVISGSVSDAAPVFETIMAACQRLFGLEAVAVYLVDDDMVRGVAHRGWSEGDWGRDAMPLAGSTTGMAIAERRTIHFPDLADKPGLPERFIAPIRKAGGLTIVYAPMLWEDRGVGSLVLSRRPAQPFSDKEIVLVQSFADQAAIAIQNARLFDEVRAKTRDLEESLAQQTATADVLKVISRSAFDLDRAASAILDAAARLCRASMATLHLRDGDVCRLAAQVGMPETFERLAREVPIPVKYPLHSRRTARPGDVAHFPDAWSDPDYLYTPTARLAGFRAIVVVPLMRDGHLVGIFSLARPDPEPFTESQIKLTQTFAEQAVIAIENVRLFDEVQARTKQLAASLEKLRATQDRLVQTEKLASLGQLTAGIAHEIKNPLNFVNNFSSLSVELVDELQEVLTPVALDQDVRNQVEEISGLLKGNLEKVASHGRRADSIVRNMLLHSRSGSGERRRVDVNSLVEESLNLAYHGARAETAGFNVTLERDYDTAAGEAELFPQEVTRVLLNLIGNGFYAVRKRAGSEEPGYEPSLTVATRDLGRAIEIRVRDNGTGIPEDVKQKMFDPFYTTKPAGEGTGLGLSLSHDIVVKQHDGLIEVATQPGAFTEFTITLPRNAATGTSGGEA